MTETGLTARVLPPDTWGQVPQHTVIVAEEAGQVVGRLTVVAAVHVEDLEIDPAHRGHPGTARALLTALLQTLHEHGVTEVLGRAERPDTAALYQHAGGVPVPGQFWALTLTTPEE